MLQGTNSDLSQYKLSREELEEKRRARQHKPLEAYSGPPVVVRSCNQHLPSPCARACPPRFLQRWAGPARARRAPCAQAAGAMLTVTVTASAAVSRLLLYRRGSSAPMDRGT